MKKRKQGRTLSRNATQRRALKRTMLVSLVKAGRIKTTLAKAKELKPFVERMITRAKKIKDTDANSLIIVIRKLKKEITTDSAKALIKIAKQYKDRKGGYLRIIKLVPRKSDSAEMAMLELVDNDKEKDIIKENKNDKDNKVNKDNKEDKNKKLSKRDK